jgi:small-conductance mechanosensitive channel
MKKGVSSLIGLFSATTTFAQSATDQAQPAAPPVPIPPIRPDKLGYPISGVEWLSRQFAVFIYDLSQQLANILGPWSKTELFLHITIAKVILGLIAALLVLGIRLIARHFLNQHAEQEKPDNSKRYWLSGIRFALKKGVSIFFFVTAALLFLSPFLPHVVFATNSESPFQVISKLAELGYLAAVLVFCFHTVRLIVNWLDARALRRPRKWFYPAFPLFGRLLHYNLIIASFQSAISLLNLAEPGQAIASKAASIATALINSILVIQMIRAVEDMAVVGTESRIVDTYKMRGLQTRLRVLRQLLIFIVAMVCLGVILMNIDAVRQIGSGLLASAGVAGVIVGLAAQKSLTTIIAGLQIALTNPMKIGDVVIVESEYGTIEEITLTYVVVKIWDLRRLILPITYFLEKPFENWTRNSSELLGTVFLYVDYFTSVDAIRAKGQEVVAASPLWDKKVYAVQVTDWKSNTVEVRILVSAESAPKLFDLRCLVREEMLAFMQEQDPESFPLVRNLYSPLPSWTDATNGGEDGDAEKAMAN